MRGGGVDVGLRHRPVRSWRGGVADAAGRDTSIGWRAGVGRFGGDRFSWYRLTSLRPGATLQLDRTALEILDRRAPTRSETYVIPPDAAVLRCRASGRDVDLAMSPDVLTGFLAWLESTPPGRTTGYRQAS